jgi:hypothetical protein
VYEANPPLPPEMLAQLWVPCDLARQWLETHGYGSLPLGEFPESIKRDHHNRPLLSEARLAQTTTEILEAEIREENFHRKVEAELDGTAARERARIGHTEPRPLPAATPSGMRTTRAEASGAKKRRGGRTEASFWAEASRIALRWLDVEGFPAPYDGNQAKFERHIANWLSARGHNASESAIRRHAVKWIAEKKSDLGA